MLTLAEFPAGVASGATHYLHWGVIQISLTNFLIIVAMVVVFALALVVPFPGTRTGPRAERRHERR